MKSNHSNIGRRASQNYRKGNIVVLAAFLLIVMMAMAALSLDVGYMCVNRAEVQRAVDAGVLAGVAELTSDRENAEAVAREYMRRNFVGSDPVPDEQIDGARPPLLVNL